MFRKASGEEVWLSTQASLPYFVVSGEMITDAPHEALLKDLSKRFEPSGLCASGASFFLGAPPKGPGVVFCLKKSKTCAFLLLNTRDCAKKTDGPGFALRVFLDYLESWISRIQNETDCEIVIDDIRNEISLPQQ
ncbi:MAG: hypothetical protein AAF360_09370 [Pseudomonadota bacterium]